MARLADCLPKADDVGVISVTVAQLKDDAVWLEVDGQRYRLSEGDTLHIGVKFEVVH